MKSRSRSIATVTARVYISTWYLIPNYTLSPLINRSDFATRRPLWWAVRRPVLPFMWVPPSSSGRDCLMCSVRSRWALAASGLRLPGSIRIAVIIARCPCTRTDRLVSAAARLRLTILLPLMPCAAGSFSVTLSLPVVSPWSIVCLVVGTVELCSPRALRRSWCWYVHITTITSAAHCGRPAGSVYAPVALTLSTCRAIPCALRYCFTTLFACRFGILDLFPACSSSGMSGGSNELSPGVVGLAQSALGPVASTVFSTTCWCAVPGSPVAARRASVVVPSLSVPLARVAGLTLGSPASPAFSSALGWFPWCVLALAQGVSVGIVRTPLQADACVFGI